MSDTKYNVLLGYDFLSQQKAIVDVNNGQLKLPHSEIQIKTQDPQLKGNNTRKQNLVRLINKITVKPGEVLIVGLRPDKALENGKEIYLHNIVPKAKNIFEEAVARVNENKIEVLVQNKTENIITLNKHMRVAQVIQAFEVKEADGKQKENNVASQNVNNITLKNRDAIYEMRKNELKAEDFDLDHIPENKRTEILEFLLKNYKVFSKSYKTLGCSDLIKPELKLQHQFGIQCRPYPTPKSIVTFLKKELDELLEAELIEPSMSEYAFPVIMVKKPSSDPQREPRYRMAIDFRLLNQITELYKVYIPHIKDITQKVAGFKLYTVVDLKAAFFQMLLPQEMRKYCSFCTQFGNFQISRLAFGLKNSGAYFTTLMNEVMRGLEELNIYFYLDDIIIAANNEGELTNKMKILFERLEQHNLTLDPAKLQLFKQEITFLGFKISDKGIEPADKNIAKITQFPRPQTIKQMRSFLGMANYFRHLINKYAETVEPLVQLTTKGQKFKWNDEAEEAFLQIQRQILEKPRIYKPNNEKTFYLNTDASATAICAILSQQVNGEFIPIEFFSRKLKPAETRYHSTKQELMAIYEGIKYFREFLYGRHFILLSDAKPLKDHLDLEKQSDMTARWLLELSKYDFEFRHIKGEENPADYLSRQVLNINIVKDLTTDLFSERGELTHTNIKREQIEYTKTRDIIEQLQKGKTIRSGKKGRYALCKESGLLVFVTDKRSRRYRRDQGKIVVPPKLQRIVLQLAHAAHFGVAKTAQLVKTTYYWPGIHVDVENYVKSCEECLKFKSKNIAPAPIERFDDIVEPMQQIAIDCVGPMRRTSRGNKYLITVIDMFSRFFVATPVSEITADTVIRVLKVFFAQYGLPRSILSDNGTSFKNEKYLKFLGALGIESKFTSPYRPQCNGRLECVHRPLKASIACITKETFSWDESVNWFMLYHNNAQHPSTGFTPAFLFFMREVRTPFHPIQGENNQKRDAVNFDPKQKYENYLNEHLKFFDEIKKEVLQNQVRAENTQTKQGKRTQVREFQVGDIVFLKREGKVRALSQKFTGPYEVIRLIRHNNVILKNKINPEERIIHIHQNKIYKAEERKPHLRERKEHTTVTQEPIRVPYCLRNKKVAALSTETYREQLRQVADTTREYFLRDRKAAKKE